MVLTFEALGVLEWLSQQGGRDQTVPEGICPVLHQPGVHQELTSHGFLLKDERLSGLKSFQLLPTSYAAAGREAKRYRQASTQLQVLSKIDETPDYGGTEDYFPTVEVRGEPLTQREFSRAVEHLRAWNLIKGIEASGSMLIRPELTALGSQILDSGYAPEDWISMRYGGGSVTNSGDTNTMNFNGGTVGAAQQGNSNTAHVIQNNGMDGEAFSNAIQAFRNLVQTADMPAHIRTGAEAQLEVIEEAVQEGKPRGRIQNFFDLLLAALPSALVSEATQLAGEAIAALPPG